MKITAKLELTISVEANERDADLPQHEAVSLANEYIYHHTIGKSVWEFSGITRIKYNWVKVHYLA